MYNRSFAIGIKATGILQAGRYYFSGPIH